MNTTTFDELERYVSIYSPCEVLFLSPFDTSKNNTILRYAGIQCPAIHCINIIEPSVEKADIIKHSRNQQYIKQMLDSFCGNDSYEQCIEFQTYNLATQSFCYLLNFIQEQNPDLLRKISIPVFHTSTNRVILANHTLSQLNIIDDIHSKQTGKLSSVASFLNRCCSPIGRRRFHYQLTNPTTDEEWLNTEYTMTDTLLKMNCLDFLRQELHGIKDIEKIVRQLIIQKIYPCSLYHLYTSIEIVNKIHDIFYDTSAICDYFYGNSNAKDYIRTSCRKILAFLDTQFVMEHCKSITSMSQFDNNIIQSGVSRELDTLISENKDFEDSFHCIRNYFNSVLVSSSTTTGTGANANDFIKIHIPEKSGITLQLTTKRSQLLKTYLDKQKESSIFISPTIEIMIKDIKFVKSSSTNVTIEFPLLNTICQKMFSIKDKINAVIANVYMSILKEVGTTFYETIDHIINYISKIDILQAKAYISKQYNYCRPEIVSSSKTAFIDLSDLRHCLIEHIQQNEIYVTNDIEFNEQQNGVLLFGTNAVGKTSFIRAIGIAIIMAQSGLYVPCSRFRFKPYTAIYSRILGNDNLFKGLSTFAVEMSELRIILKMADENSMVLGDELCSGTETESALSIFVAGLMHLHKKQVSFIFATHFHEIMQYEEIKELERMAAKHMAIHYDREKGRLIYDRKLKNGSGPRIYGLEVCKSLYMEDEFLDSAYRLRNKYYPETKGQLSFSGSVYNSKKIKGICEVCGTHIGEEVHHLMPQKYADENGFIGSFHKNHPANLMNICQSCHDTIHSKKTISEAGIPVVRKKTTDGYTLV
jgi:DNA mismatch repair protein MutS